MLTKYLTVFFVSMVPLIELRVGLAALFLLPAAIWRGRLPLMARHWKAILVVGTLNAALPFGMKTFQMFKPIRECFHRVLSIV